MGDFSAEFTSEENSGGDASTETAAVDEGGEE